MTTLHAEQALIQGGWRNGVRVTLADGRIGAVETGVAPQPGDERHAVLLPAMPNLHSHAFQRAMAGLAERRHTGNDTFWSWRDLMYRLALSMTPAQVQAVAAQAYIEMLESGFSRVGEFHYLHHDVDGRPYGDIAEMAAAVAGAASDTGIGLTLLPVFYAHSSFGGAPPNDGQRRFINSVDRYADLLDGCRRAVKPLPHAIVGVAPHSLRAVTPEELTAVTGLAPASPIHIHIAEQMREVEDSIAWSGQRPIDWLLDHAPVSGRWCLVHATHMTEAETTRTAASRAVVGLCPITEANLGDGVFNAPTFTAAGGRYGIGSDSNVQIGVADELRLLEYSQRLARHGRNVMARPGGSTGRALFDDAIQGGARAVGTEPLGLAVGGAGDMIALNTRHAAFAGAKEDALLDAWIFSAGNTGVDCVWVNGEKVVAGGRHRARDDVTRGFFKVMKDLAA
ncbi:MAG: formimidoylglutamate deiminase [Rhodospirillaceae bacterium]